jgi:hypothetical protein
LVFGGRNHSSPQITQFETAAARNLSDGVLANAFSVASLLGLVTQGCDNPGLQLENAFGVASLHLRRACFADCVPASRLRRCVLHDHGVPASRPRRCVFRRRGRSCFTTAAFLLHDWALRLSPHAALVQAALNAKGVRECQPRVGACDNPGNKQKRKANAESVA